MTMVTATPKDRDIESFKQSTGFVEVHKIAISRTDCVEADLIKKGVKAIAFLVDDETRAILIRGSSKIGNVPKPCDSPCHE